MDIGGIVARQREFFASGKTLDVDFRLASLAGLQEGIRRHEQAIHDALQEDLRKTAFEGYMTETGMVLDEIRFTMKHLRAWTKTRRVPTPMSQFHGTSSIVPQPRGVVLIMAPWNYPFQLCLEPLVGALGAGNTAVIKPSAYAPETGRAVSNLIADVFPHGYVDVVQGGRTENAELLEQRFDYIFFTGSVEVGRHVMAQASRHLTPVTLELGGKSPVIVDASANLQLAARRIAFGKFLNAGQTCVAPDYLLVDRTVKEEFLRLFIDEIQRFFPDGDYHDMPVIINDKHYVRLMALIEGMTVRFGGRGDARMRFIEPTVLDDVDMDAPVMREEIFGPILPVLAFASLGEAVAMVASRPKPLALYLFTTDRAVRKRVLRELSFGGGCVNDTVIHLATPHLGFGGVGESGMGSYHGKSSFDTFTHYKSVMCKANWIDLSMRYHPYTEQHFKLVRRFLK